MPSTATLAGRRYAFGLDLFPATVKYFAGWILAAVVIAAVVPLIVSQWRSVDISAWYIAANVGKYLIAIIIGGFVHTLLPIMVAQGLTRREFATAMGIFGLLWSLFTGAIAIAGFLGERAYFSAMDWTQAVGQDDPGIVLRSVGDALDFAKLYPLSYVLYGTAGALIGAAIYRSDSGWLAIVPVVPVTLAVDDAMSDAGSWGPSWLVQFTSVVTDSWGEWIAAAVAVAAIVIGAWVARRIIIDSPIRSKQA